MGPDEHSDLVDSLLAAVLAAGRVQLAHYARGLAVERKADRSPVTQADRESEEILLAALQQVRPNVPVIAEEAVSEGRIPAIADRFFLVDPLDGTREFIEGRDEFTINIALVEAGRPRLGIVYAPALGRLYATCSDTAAVQARLPPESQVASLAAAGAQPIRVRHAVPGQVVAVASRLHLTPQTAAWLSRLDVTSYRQAGSSLKFCLVAAGEADVYPRFGPTCEWDTAAGDAVLCAAGGRVTTPEGLPLPYGKADRGFLNPHFIAWGGGDLAVPCG